jgi:hypothetical protein
MVLEKQAKKKIKKTRKNKEPQETIIYMADVAYECGFGPAPK